MPKPTFFNLPSAKREAVLTAARAEFAGYDPGDVSISRLVAAAGIAKGSFYQYFEGKEDLHLYLLDQAVRLRSRYVAEMSPSADISGFFDRIRWFMAASAKFHLTYPEEDRLMRRAITTDHPLRAEATKLVRGTISAVWESIIQQGVAAGELDGSFHPDLIQFVFSTLTAGLGEQVAGEASGAADSQQHSERFFSVFAEVVRLLEFGLRPRKS